VPVNPNTYRHWVTLEDVPDATPVTYDPARVKCAIEPLSPGSFDESRTTHLVQMRYHPQVSFQTQLTFTDRNNATHRLFVKGIQNERMQNRALTLLCEEVMTPA
jgi:hypothetical protein